MNNEDVKNKFDARIVQAVRNLKSRKSLANQDKDSTNDEIVQRQTPIININNNGNTIIEEDKQSSHQPRNGSAIKVEKHSSSKKIESTRMFIDNREKLLNNENIIQSNQIRRTTAKLPTSSHITLIDHLRKPKTNYQKNILSEVNLIKHMQSCLNLLKLDNQLKNLCLNTGLIEENHVAFLNENFFHSKTFLFKLEILILNDMSENSSMNKIYSMNKGKSSSFKAIKNQFFKEEMRRYLEVKLSESRFEDKINCLNKDILKHIDDIKNYEL